MRVTESTEAGDFTLIDDISLVDESQALDCGKFSTCREGCSFADTVKFFSGNTIGERLSFVLIFVLWFYLFLPFRPFGFPVSYGQIEEWTLSAAWLSIIGLIILASFPGKKHVTFRITVCDILLFLYFVYILFRINGKEDAFTLYTLTFLYIIVRTTDRFHLRFVVPALVISVIFQACNDFYRHDNTWEILPDFTGLFYNTGIWGGFAGIACTGIYGLLLFAKRYKIFLSGLLPVLAILLVYSQSRAAWIGAFAGTGFLSFFFLWKKFGSGMIRPAIITFVLSVPFFIFAGWKLYNLKPVSADGRFYIWKISSQMVNAQVNDTVKLPQREPTIVREGNLTYHRIGNTMERPETKDPDRKGKSYERVYFFFTNDLKKQIADPLIRSVFSEEREKQLAGKRLVCYVIFSPVENRIVHISFLMSITDDSNFPLTLSELDELERKLRAEPKLTPFSSDGEIVDRLEPIQIVFRFGSLNE